jgi:ribosomal protein S12 methylthiotransferase
VERVYVMGCLSERYLAELEEDIPEVDGWYGKFNYRKLLADLSKATPIPHSSARKLTTPHHYAYLKISEGCDRQCAYCAIPLITGKHRSRPMEEILDEVRWLVSKGVKELQVIAQELTYYGVDLYGEQKIAELVERMADIEGVEWIRLHYAYPTHFPWDLLRVMREKQNVCKYLDIALQHISDNMLTRMKRYVTKEQTMALLERMRREVPGIHIRTTLMVGFPGETDEDFQELIEFTKWARFERMGAFAYSEEDGTYSAENYDDDVPDDVKQHRLDKLMRIQQNISAEIEAAKVGLTLKVVIDRREGDYYVGRTEFCSPDVDPEVLVEARQELTIGQFYQVKITDSEEFDLYGEIVK